MKCDTEDGFHQYRLKSAGRIIRCSQCGRSLTHDEAERMINAALVMPSERARAIADEKKVYLNDQKMLRLYAARLEG